VAFVAVQRSIASHENRSDFGGGLRAEMAVGDIRDAHPQKMSGGQGASIPGDESHCFLLYDKA
jgi:hypothetical protein